MGRLILSEDATVEVDGRICFLKKGTAVRVRKHENCFKVDEDFQINTHRGKMLVESGNVIYMRNIGAYKAISESMFRSDGKAYAIENGDRFYVIDESFWEGFKTGFTGAKAKSEAVAKIGTAASDIIEMIDGMHNDWVEQNPKLRIEQSPFNSMITSKEYDTLVQIAQNAGNPRVIRKLMIMKRIGDPIKAIDELRKAAYDEELNDLGEYIDEIAPPGSAMKQISKWWQSMTTGKGGASLSKKMALIGTDSDGKQYIMRGNQIGGPMNVAQDGKMTRSSEYQVFDFVGDNTYKYGDKKVVIVKREHEGMGQAAKQEANTEQLAPNTPTTEQVNISDELKNSIYAKYTEFVSKSPSADNLEIVKNIAKMLVDRNAADKVKKFGGLSGLFKIVRQAIIEKMKAEPVKSTAKSESKPEAPKESEAVKG